MSAPPRMNLRALALAGERRAHALKDADQALEDVARHLDEVRRGGGRVNVKLAASLAGVSRDTIYERLRAQENTHA